MFLYLAGEAAVEVVLPWVVEAVADAHFLCRSIPHAAQLVVEVQQLVEVAEIVEEAVEAVEAVVEVQPLGAAVDLPLTDLLPVQTLAA